MSIYSDWEKKEFQYGWLVVKRDDLQLYSVSPISKMDEGREACEPFVVKLFDDEDKPYFERRVYVGTDTYQPHIALYKGQYYIER